MRALWGRTVDDQEQNESEMSGFDLFTGYLVFDAWIANTDRHAINWGVLSRNVDGRRFLAPSFDHGSALASGVQDKFMATKDASAYAERGMAHRFENGMNLPLVELALQAVARTGTGAHQWVERIGELDAEVVESVVHAVPGMSELRRSFVHTLLDARVSAPHARLLRVFLPGVGPRA